MASSTFNEFSNDFKVNVTEATTDSSCVIESEEVHPIQVKVMDTNIERVKVTKPEKKGNGRKSCLRASHFSNNSQQNGNKNTNNQLNVTNSNSSNSNTRSSFFRLKNIDRPFENKEN